MKKQRLPAPRTAEKVEGGYRVKDDHRHWLALVYAKEDQLLDLGEARSVPLDVVPLDVVSFRGNPALMAAA